MRMHTKRFTAPLAAVLLLLLPGMLTAANGQLAGLAVYTDTARDIYIAGLLTADGIAPAAGTTRVSAPAAMQFRIATRRISDRGLSGTILLQAEVGAGQRAPEAVIDGLEQLKQRLKGALSNGDQFEIALSTAGSTVFSLNGVQLLSLPGSEVFDFLLQGWIGNSASALMRDSLLAGKLNDVVLQRYESLIPLEERRQLAAQWAAGSAVAVAAAPAVPEKPAVAEAKPVEKPAVAEAPEVARAEPAAAPPAAEQAPVAAVEAEVASEPVAAVEPEVVAEPEPEAVAVAAVQEAEPEPELDADAAWVATLDDREYQQNLNEYISSVMIKVFRSVKYPKRAIKREWEGQVEVLALVDSAGQLLNVSLENSSGRDILDEAAVEAVESASPFPSLTPVAKAEFLSETSDNSYFMLIPVKFQLN